MCELNGGDIHSDFLYCIYSNNNFHSAVVRPLFCGRTTCLFRHCLNQDLLDLTIKEDYAYFMLWRKS